MNTRQQFLTSVHYVEMSKFLASEEGYWRQHGIEADSPAQERTLKSQRVYQAKLQNVFLEYTAGSEIESLQPLITIAIDAFEHYQQHLALSEGIQNIAPLIIDDWLPDYEEFVQTASICVLLDRTDLLARYISVMDNAGYKWQDTLYEDLLRRRLPDRKDIDQWHHPEYTKLIRSIYAKSKAESSVLLAEYCNEWYPAFEQATWHDSHKDGEDGSYCGYWAFEAGAIAYLYEIDDSDIKHMVYPKDLVEYARHHRSPPNHDGPQKAYAGLSCPRDGYWYTPAKENSRRFFKQGEIMPEFKESLWGATIWYWSGERE